MAIKVTGLQEGHAYVFGVEGIVTVVYDDGVEVESIDTESDPSFIRFEHIIAVAEELPEAQPGDVWEADGTVWFVSAGTQLVFTPASLNFLSWAGADEFFKVHPDAELVFRREEAEAKVPAEWAVDNDWAKS